MFYDALIVIGSMMQKVHSNIESNIVINKNVRKSFVQQYCCCINTNALKSINFKIYFFWNQFNIIFSF